MGTWGYGNFDNDTATDFLGDFRDTPTTEKLAAVLHHVCSLALDDKYLDVSDCQEALAASEIVAASRSKPSPDFPADMQELAVGLELEKAFDYAEFHNWSIRAVWFIREESELRELWLEADELSTWEQIQENLLRRLA